MAFPLSNERVRDRQAKGATRQIGQAIRTEHPIYSEQRLRFMFWSLLSGPANFNLDRALGCGRRGVNASWNL